MEYTGLITVNKDGEKNNIHLEFTEDKLPDIMSMFDTLLECAKGEVIVFAKKLN